MHFVSRSFVLSLFILTTMVACNSPYLAAQDTTLTLAQAMDMARQRAPLILSAKGRIEEARGRLAGALVRFRDNPLIELDAGPRFLPNGRLAAIDVGVSQNLELGGKRDARIAGAQAGIARETAVSEDTLRGLLRDVGTAFARALWAEKRLALLQTSEKLAADFLATEQKRYDAGDIAALDLNLAKTSAVRARSEVRSATADRTEALGDLKIFLGMSPEGQLAIRGDLSEKKDYDLNSLLAVSAERPDMKAVAAELQEAEADVRLGNTFKWPELAVGGKYTRDEGDNIVQGGVKITLPVFAKGQELQATGNARAARLRTDLEALRRTARSEVKTAFTIQQFRKETVDELEKTALPGLEENDELAKRSYEEGELGLTELIFLRRENLETRLVYANSLLEAALSSLDLEFKAGVLR
jgi:outer membrane protein, heavy metal efflux system